MHWVPAPETMLAKEDTMTKRIGKTGKFALAFALSASLFSGLALAAPQEAGAAWSEAKANAIIKTAKAQLGKPYKFGASTSTTRHFDCSSFTKYAYGKHGITLARSSKQQAKQGVYVARKNLKKGDLVFFDVSSKRAGIDHVAIYVGNNTLLHTYKAGVGVTYTKLSKKYWSDRYVTARRVIR
jgi:cell wall-associated NlpC family hydrolase